MSDLPITNNETPLLIPAEIKPIQPATPDLSNPYMYPANPQATINASTTENIPLNDENPNISFNEASTDGDPELQKIKSSFWKKAGQLQSAIGSLTGLDSWQKSGTRTEEEAEREYRDAEERLNRGEASRIHGEYDRLKGYVTYAVGHVAGDAEMQAKANESITHGAAEIDKSNK
ncbi:unnamed protein product [Mucor hiemalis]